MKHRDEELERLKAEWIEKNGVTKCPTVNAFKSGSLPTWSHETWVPLGNGAWWNYLRRSH